MAYTYMLRCRDGTLYVGSTRNLDQRLEQHQLGLGSAYTRRRLPVELVWFEEHEHIGAAFGREKQIQNWSRAKRQALIDHRYDLLPALARGRRVGLDTGSPSGSPGSTNEQAAARPTNEQRLDQRAERRIARPTTPSGVRMLPG